MTAAASAATVPAGRSLRAPLALVLMGASGFAGLGYQIVWTQQGALWLGHEAAAVLAVVTAFFGGLSLGALTLGRRIERSAQPERWYAACEVLIAAWSGVLVVALAPASGLLLSLTGEAAGPARQWAVAFFGTLLLLLPATAAMGATLPAMERLVARAAWPGGGIAALYAANTTGAVLGVLACAFWLVPAFGLTATATVCAVLNLGCAALVIWRSAAALAPPAELPAAAVAAPTPSRKGRLALRLAITGLLGIGYEVLVVRVLGQLTEQTVYTFAMLLAVYLMGTAAGAALYHRWRQRAGFTAMQRVRDHLLLALAAACLLSTAGLWGAEALLFMVRQIAGAGLAGALLSEAVLATAAFALPTLVMGALFSHLAHEAQVAGIAFGRALGINTLGATLAPWLFGVVLLPAAGAKLALLAVALGYLALLSRPRGPAASAAAAVLAVAVLAPPLAFIDVPEGGHVVSYREGAMAAVSVVEDADGVTRLRIDNRQQEGSSGTLLADARQALLPLLLHPAPQRALFLGLGTGMTARSAAQDPTLQVDVAELLPEVIAASAYFAKAFDSGAPNPRLHVVAADARRTVRGAGPGRGLRYDIVVADNFHPARSGSGSLYTVEHFRAVQGRLAEGGLFCQWLPLHQLDLATLRSIVRAFVTVYPGASALLATNSLETPVLGLMARADGGRFGYAALRQRLAGHQLPQRLADYGIGDPMALLGGFVAGPQALARFAAGAPLNTDDHPVVAYMAPRITYAPDSRPRDRLLELLGQLAVRPAEIVDAGADSEVPARLAAYWSARDQFIAAGRDVQPAADVRAMLAQVRQPLLDALRTSPDFRPAYEPLLAMARALGRDDPAAAQVLLSELVRLQPAWPEAAQALQALASRAP